MKRSRILNGIPINERNRFTCFVKTSDLKGWDILERWEQWFTSQGIACAIAETDKGFAVYRLGLQDDDEE